MRRSSWIRVLAVAVATAVVSASAAAGYLPPVRGGMDGAQHCGVPAAPGALALTHGGQHTPDCPAGFECLTAAGCAPPPVALTAPVTLLAPGSHGAHVPAEHASQLDLFRTGPPTPPPNS